ncbi:MAG: hypothetical protein AAF479_16805 [Pseudomonadota bacterium]
MLKLWIRAFFAVVLLSATGASATAVLSFGGTACHNLMDCDVAFSSGDLAGSEAHLFAPKVTGGRQDFFGFSDGLILGTQTFPHEFRMSFERNVAWLGGDLGLTNGLRGLRVSGSALSNAHVQYSTGPGVFTLAAPVLFAAGETYVLSAMFNPDFGVAVLRELSFAEVSSSTEASPVPLPAPGMLLMFALLGLGVVKLSRPHRA